MTTATLSATLPVGRSPADSTALAERSYMIESLEVENFRCFNKLSLDGLGKVNVVVGDNGAGKTALPVVQGAAMGLLVAVERPSAQCLTPARLVTSALPRRGAGQRASQGDRTGDS